jgi:hypothetical protein
LLQTGRVCPSFGTATAAPRLFVPPATYASAQAIADPFRYTVTVTKGARTATSEPVVVFPVLAPMPNIDISVTVPAQGGTAFRRIMPSNVIVLAATMTPASSDPNAPIPPYTLRWTCSDASINMSVGSRALLSSPTSANLVLAANALAAGSVYAFKLTLSSTDAVPQDAWASVVVATSRLPAAGSCSMVPLPGDARATVLSVVFQSEVGRRGQTEREFEF